ncbi:MAG: cell division protein FtsA [Verrucomicrobiota bacterium]
MARSNIYVGLEMGTTQVTAVVGEVKADGAIKILGIGNMPARGVRKGEIVDNEIAAHCLQDAIRKAEERADVAIESVYLAVAGPHLASLNHRGCVRINEDAEVTEDDLEEIKRIAKDVTIPDANAFLHTIIRRYYLDGQDGVEDPVGMRGSLLEADYHIIHGIKTRLQNAIRFVRLMRLEVEDVVFGPLAASQILLKPQDKEEGALVIDIGGGTTDYLLYDRGSVCQSGSLGVGGDHINNDISLVMKVQIQLAERLKKEYGSAIVTDDQKKEIVLEDETRFNGREIDQDMLHEIINCRIEEIFEYVKKPLEAGGYLDRIGSGIFLTGGTSLLPGIDEVAEEIFGVPVLRPNSVPINGSMSIAENPQYTTAIGLIRYAQLQDQERPPASFIQRFGAVLGEMFGVSRVIL